MRQRLLAWMVMSRDTGLLPEVEMWKRAGEGTILDLAADAKRFPVYPTLVAADLVGRERATAEDLAKRLADEDAAIRYWAAVGLSCMGDKARPAAKSLTDALDDASPPVRFAAAEALCRLGQPDQAVRVLADGLNAKDQRVRLDAAATLVAVGQPAAEVLPQIRRALELERRRQGNFPMYIGWALQRAISQLAR
jgi:HEAT repeat protein